MIDKNELLDHIIRAGVHDEITAMRIISIIQRESEYGTAWRRRHESDREIVERLRDRLDSRT